mmetsp:Transcript_29276/g.29015  ORF Transcript_29276/g.29015 Transcript_29276/m.29015 type:complete len:103 (+) Transcript_29276:6-314(+)
MLAKSIVRLFSKSFYELLEVEKTADKQAIKAAYYKHAKIHHPDAQNSDPEIFKEYAEAYNTLIDDDKRYQYDIDNGFLDAMDVDRMEELKEKFGTRYPEKAL